MIFPMTKRIGNRDMGKSRRSISTVLKMWIWTKTRIEDRITRWA